MTNGRPAMRGWPAGLVRAVGLALVMASGAVPARAQTTTLRWADSLQAHFARATLVGDAAAWRAGVELSERALQAAPDDALLQHYRGYALYRVAQTQAAGAARDSVLEAALRALEQSGAVLPLPETDALRASVMGQLMAGSMLRGMRYGAAASRAEGRALARGENPRALLLLGITTFYKPGLFGGGVDKGRALVERAITAFATDKPAPGYPAWGAAEVYAWRGIMARKAGDLATARAAFEQALALAPDYRWVRDVLLPSVAPANGGAPRSAALAPAKRPPRT